MYFVSLTLIFAFRSSQVGGCMKTIQLNLQPSTCVIRNNMCKQMELSFHPSNRSVRKNEQDELEFWGSKVATWNMTKNLKEVNFAK